MKYLNSYKLFENYQDWEYINTDILMDVLGDIAVNSDVTITVNTMIDDNKIPSVNFGVGYFRATIPFGANLPGDKFGVYSIKFYIDTSRDFSGLFNGIVGSIKKSLVYYYDQSGDKIVAFYLRSGERNELGYTTDQNDRGLLTYLEVFFSREEILDYTNNSFNKRFDIIKPIFYS